MLRHDKPEWLRTAEGRDLFRVSQELVKGSMWEMSVFPAARSQTYLDEKKTGEGIADELFDLIETKPELSYEAAVGFIEMRVNAENIKRGTA